MMEKFEPLKGVNIESAVEQCKGFIDAIYTDQAILVFNDVEVVVNKESFTPDIVRIYLLQRDLARFI